MGGISKRFWWTVRQSWLVDQVRSLLPNWVVNTFWHWPIAYLAAIWYGFPAKKLTLIGVTGTDGKTTTVYLINHILKTAGKKTAMISSVTAEIGGEESDTGFHVTSPHPFAVQSYLKRAVERGVEYAVLEVTSHALDQHRFAGCNFKVGVVTNVRPDHLDYHKTFENYLLSKARLLISAQISAVNKDDDSFSELTRLLEAAKKKFMTYSMQGDTSVTPQTIGLREQPRHLPGKYNLSNILASAAVVRSLGLMKRRAFHKAVQTFPGVPGRFEEIETGKNFRVIIDFAHTPYALQELLQTLRTQMQDKGKLIAVFGCAAERGKERRKMGKTSAELADITIITAEDPRFEGVEKISKEIAQWAIRGGAKEVESKESEVSSKKEEHVFVSIPDRQEAIDFAVKIASKGDIVALCGKGHEKSMNFKGKEYPWDEREAVEKALKLKFQVASTKFQTNSKHQ